MFAIRLLVYLSGLYKTFLVSLGFQDLLTLEPRISNHEHRDRFGLFPLRSPLLGESIILSLPPGT